MTVVVIFKTPNMNYNLNISAIMFEEINLDFSYPFPYRLTPTALE